MSLLSCELNLFANEVFNERKTDAFSFCALGSVVYCMVNISHCTFVYG